MKSKSHYTLGDRMAIEDGLNECLSIKQIADDIRKLPSGVIKEINKHYECKYFTPYNNSHPCLKWRECNVKGRECYLTCKNIEYKLCPKLKKSPHVCNGCKTKAGCHFVKRNYSARQAHDLYKDKLSSSRTGLHYNETEELILKERLCPLIIITKSVYHSVLAVNEKFKVNFKKNTIYKQIERNQLPISSSDLPRCRKRKVQKKDTNYKRDITNHSYEDYEKYKKENSKALELQMDTVEGVKENNAPVLLTLEIVEINFLFMFKIDSQTVEAVVSKLKEFKDIIGKNIFDKIAEILLTDNGKEFINIELISSVSSKINLYYCHPYSSYEKGSIENNHELIRRVIPKGVSLKPYTQVELNLLCSHINSLFRESLNGKCPFDLINKYISDNKLKKLGLEKIDPMEVRLIPELLGEKNINNIKKYLDKDDIKKANIKFKSKE